ncbi:PTS sugar transporter subunit IIA [Luteimonas sp. SJ-92]|uniref:PTS sugar transporter subunit IIA n=1 Tax=Luteimonas salinisoli TaxID=2752307 RepID=A0A853JDS4_9GAMM|nr:PTS sugar transporter subunit IIA [Luteimonas salinisoli]NZA27471.1 PTS sugar transporter subunit IIA [Luteimonas salinisoli]
MPCTDLLAAERIAILAGPASREAVLDAVARLLGTDPADAGRIGAMLHAREAQCSTGIGHGVAIPHVRGGRAPTAAFLKLSAPAGFDACDGEPVDLVFAMRVPDDHPQDHLQVLADLAGCFADPGFRGRLRACEDVDALRTVLLGDAWRRAA